MIPLAAQLGAAAAGAVIAFSAGWKVHDWKTTSALVKEKEQALLALQQKQRDYNAASDELEKFRAENQKLREQTVVEVEKIVQRPVYIRDCFDDDGLRTLYAAIDRKPQRPSESASAVRGTK